MSKTIPELKAERKAARREWHRAVYSESRLSLHATWRARKASKRRTGEAAKQAAVKMALDAQDARNRREAAYVRLRAAEDALRKAQLAALSTEHVTDGSPCWCNPELNFVDPDTKVEVWVHKQGRT
jgi:hypothetical protein